MDKKSKTVLKLFSARKIYHTEIPMDDSKYLPVQWRRKLV